jgi:hypothetical protein
MIGTSARIVALVLCAFQASATAAPLKPLVRVVPIDEHHRSVTHTNYILGHLISVTPTWLVAELQETDGHLHMGGGNFGGAPSSDSAPFDPDPNGLLAVRLSDGTARELLPPPSETPDQINAISQHYQQGDSRCIAVLSTYQKLKNKQCSLVDSSAWEWSLETNALRALGPWTYADMLTPILDANLVTVRPASAQTTDRMTVTLAQTHGTKSVSVLLKSPQYSKCETVFEHNGDTIFSQTDRRSIVIFRGKDDDDDSSDFFTLDCIDPAAPTGHRWIIRPSDIQAWTGTAPTDARPLNGLDGNRGLLALDVTGANASQQQRELIVLVDEVTGKAQRIVVLARTLKSDETLLWPFLSGDGAKTIYFEQENRPDPGVSKAQCLLSIIDTRTPRGILREDVSQCCSDQDTIIQYDLKNARLLTADSEQIQWLSTRSPHECQIVFRLNGRDRQKRHRPKSK